MSAYDRIFSNLASPVIESMPGGPYEPPDSYWGTEIVELDCPECGKPLEFDMDYQKYCCTNDICSIANACMKMTAEDVYDLQDSEVTTSDHLEQELEHVH